MTLLTLDIASYPDGFTATAADSGGSLPASTQYYYRIACVTDEGETCACASAEDTTPAGAADNKIDLAWNAVAGVKATGGYIIYRNTSDAWTTGSLEYASSNTNSYADTGAGSASADVPHTFSSDDCGVIGENEESLSPALNLPGQEGGTVQYMGAPPKRFTVEGFTMGTSAITDLGLLRDIREGGVPITVTVSAFSQTWISDTYYLESFNWSLEPGTAAAGGEFLRWTLNFVEE